MELLKFCVVLISSVQVHSIHFKSLSHLKPSASSISQTVAAQDLFKRILAGRAGEFDAIVNPNIGQNDKDKFTITNKDKRVEIVGTTGVAAAMGLYYYLTNYCHCQITWGGRQLNIPSPLPVVDGGSISITTNDKFRYYQNVCTVSYSFVWYKWSDWEKQIDWMALRGINLPLAFTGQEAIFQRVYSRLGLNMTDLQNHFGGPAFLAWSRMGNMHGWGGPIKQTWINDQLILQHKILTRMRALGMIPVLPGFAGHVPDAMTVYYPKANVSRLRDWGHFNSTYCCNYLLDFKDPLFMKIAVRFIQEMEYEFGVDHVYNVDTFNEMTPRSNSPEYLAMVSQTIYNSLKAADPQAIWLMQGWLFQDTGFWKPPQIKALLTSIPLGAMIVLDLFSEVAPIYNYTQSYYGQPFIWCMLHNFGGTMELYGALHQINVGPCNGRTFSNSTMVGLGLTPEGIYQNEIVYEFFMENTWRKEPVDVAKWVDNYVLNRYGKTNAYVQMAWQHLKDSVYNNHDSLRDHNKNGIPVSRPRLTPPLEPDIWYAPEVLFIAWDILTDVADDFRNSTLFLYDLVDVTRNSLQILCLKYYNNVVAGFVKNDTAVVKSNGSMLLEILEDLDTLLASDSHFLLGKWLKAATDLSVDFEDSWFLEFNARNQITLWGPRGEIRDYACKQWSGLVKDYYLPRWQIFMNYTLTVMNNGLKYNTSKLNDMIYHQVELPFSYRLDQYPTEPQGDSVKIVKSIHQKYRPETQSRFFQGFGSNAGKQRDNVNWIQKKYQVLS